MIGVSCQDRICFLEMQDAKHFNCLGEELCGELSAIKRQFRILSRFSATISSESFERINCWRQRVYNGPDYKEGIRSFFEKRAPQYVGKASDLDIHKDK